MRSVLMGENTWTREGLIWFTSVIWGQEIKNEWHYFFRCTKVEENWHEDGMWN
ncbi:hypothetical protein MTR_5g093365 [Medicago truncatula]|uniref:Uncharacterized protein n=1 Tax=Medicago truncatula TaxID=3880 RepID=A0A072URD7_MEDTR|nr:hypothetical protein MTR_5g093365 [Medicago truncatula]